MERIELTAQVRDKTGKGVARGLRRSAMIPAVLYGHGKSVPIALGSKEIMKVLNTEGGEHALINLKLEGAKEATDRLAMIKDYQTDPITDSPIHLDLLEVAMDEKVRVAVSVHLVGTSIGIKEGGIVQHGQREIEIECLPNDIPDYLEVDITNLKVNESLHIRDMQIPAGIKTLSDAEATVVTIQPPVSQEKLDEMLAAAPAVEEAEQPELVKKPKEEAAAPEEKQSEVKK